MLRSFPTCALILQRTSVSASSTRRGDWTHKGLNRRPHGLVGLGDHAELVRSNKSNVGYVKARVLGGGAMSDGHLPWSIVTSRPDPLECNEQVLPAPSQLRRSRQRPLPARLCTSPPLRASRRDKRRTPSLPAIVNEHWVR